MKIFFKRIRNPSGPPRHKTWSRRFPKIASRNLRVAVFKRLGSYVLMCDRNPKKRYFRFGQNRCNRRRNIILNPSRSGRSPCAFSSPAYPRAPSRPFAAYVTTIISPKSFGIDFARFLLPSQGEEFFGYPSHRENQNRSLLCPIMLRIILSSTKRPTFLK